MSNDCFDRLQAAREELARQLTRIAELERAFEVLLRDYLAVHGDGDLEMQPALNQARAALAEAKKG